MLLLLVVKTTKDVGPLWWALSSLSSFAGLIHLCLLVPIPPIRGSSNGPSLPPDVRAQEAK